jgi:hypothetical protein
MAKMAVRTTIVRAARMVRPLVMVEITAINASPKMRRNKGGDHYAAPFLTIFLMKLYEKNYQK